MPLTDDQQRLCDALETLSDIDTELDEIRSREDHLTLRRRMLAQKRIDLENRLRAAHAAAGYPAIVVPVNDRVVIFDSRVGVLSIRLASPTMFALLAAPTPQAQPEPNEILVAHPMSTTSIPAVTHPEFNEEDA
jgi:hypothetical protein